MPDRWYRDQEQGGGTMAAIILLFSIAVFAASFFIVKRYERMDHFEVAFYIVLIAWCSLLIGMVASSKIVAA
jgi:hypothetical protein